MTWLTDALTSSIGKKGLMALSGLLLGLFVIAHLLGNATALAGRAAFIAYAEQLHAFGRLLWVLEGLLLVVFLCHVITALQLWFANRAARPVAYAVSPAAGGRTWASCSMFYSGLFLLLFLAVHLWQFHFNDRPVTVADLVRETLQTPLIAAFYLAGVAALALHVSHGFWSLWQSLGLEHPKYNKILRQGAVAAALLIGLLFSLLPLGVLFWPPFLR